MCRPYLGRTPAGVPIRPFRSFPSARTREEAQALADTWVASLTADGRVASSRVGDLLEEYVGMRARRGLAPNTVRTWRTLARRYVAPLIGRRPAREVGVVEVNRMEDDLLREGGDGGAPLSRGTVRLVHTMLSGAWDHWVAAGVCESNPVRAAARPVPDPREAKALSEWDFGEVSRAIEAAMDPGGATASDLGRISRATAAWVALHTGMRVGEVCGLRRRDVVRSGGYLHVGGSVTVERGRRVRRDVTKGRRSRNVTVTPDEMAVIGRYMALQDRLIGRRLGGEDPLVTPDGRFMSPTATSNSFGRLARSLGLPRGMTFHGLRHTHATWCLMSGVDLKTLSERLGHADEATTLRFYAHAMPGRDRAAAEAFERAARGVAS